MKILVACEESQAVTIELRKLGHEAYSCDIIECSGGHPEWHIRWDALALINGRCSFVTSDGELHSIDGAWDMLIAHPPCTYLSNAGARFLYPKGVLNEERLAKGLEAKDFFMHFYNADCPRIAIENPIPSKAYGLPPYSQTVQPWMFGHPVQKKHASGSRDCLRWSLRTSLMNGKAPRSPATGSTTEARNDRKTGPRHSLVSQKPWQSSGQVRQNDRQS